MLGGAADARGQDASRLVGAALALAGVGMAGAGLWARRDVSRTLARERIARLGPGANGGLVATAADARALADFVRANTLKAAGGRTYAEVGAYVGPDGEPTTDPERAVRDPLTGAPAEHPDHALWIQSTTLQTALMQAYMAFRLAELTTAVGAAFAAAGLGLGLRGAQPRRPRRHPLRLR